jgi:uncharacterized protein involved in tolerance to divalent cations
MKAIAIICSTLPFKEKTEGIAQLLLYEKIVGCIQFHPIKSFYWWNGVVANDYL